MHHRIVELVGGLLCLLMVSPTLAYRTYLPMTTSGSVVPTSPPVPITNAIINGNFSNGTHNWSLAGPVTLTATGGMDGTPGVRLGGKAGEAVLTKMFTVPRDTPYLYYYSRSRSTRADCYYDSAWVAIASVAEDGTYGWLTPLTSAQSLCSVDNHEYRLSIVDLPDYRGQHIVIAWIVKQDMYDEGRSYWTIDNVSLERS